MSQFSLNFANAIISESSPSSIRRPLMVAETDGQFRAASDHDVLCAARDIIETLTPRTKVMSPAEAKTFVQVKLVGLEREVFAMLLLDNQHGLIAYVEPFAGTIDQATVHPREMVKLALQHNAAAVILAHNHPSRSSEASKADVATTSQLVAALDLVGVRVLDHLIVAGHVVTSMAQLGLM